MSSKRIMDKWAEECERVGATTFSRHSLNFLKNCIDEELAERDQLRALLDEAIAALEWAADEVCPHADAIKQLEDNPKMNRAFCTCSSWVYRGDTENKARATLEKLKAQRGEK